MSRSTWFAPVLMFAAFAVTQVACSRDDHPQAHPSTSTPPEMCDLPASCRAIVRACMSKDDGTPGALHDCHMTGMVKGIEADCAKVLSSCTATCAAAPALSDAAPEDFFAMCRDGGAPVDAGGGSTGFPASPLSTFTSEGKDLTIELRTAPFQPIHVGPGSEAQLRITDATTGAPVDGLGIAVSTTMLVMGHPCSQVPIKVEPQSEGVYVLTPFLASMKGSCEIKLTFSGPRTGHAVSPAFDITQ
jgi:hypothetical protein